MSTQYPGGFITKSPVAPTTSAASGIWTVDQALQYVKAGTWPSPPIFIEDMFSTTVYTGTGSFRGIDFGWSDAYTQGGMFWFKARTSATNNDNFLFDTVRSTSGSGNLLLSNSVNSNTTAAQTTAGSITVYNSGTTLTTSASIVNENAINYVLWSFKEQPKFFDIVTYTGDGAARTLAHNLGSVPGCMIVKRTDTTANWATYHRSLNGGLNPQQYVILLNSTGAYSASSGSWNNTAPTSTGFSVGTDATVNASGGTYVAYLFAHDAGGFPVSGGGSTNGITCGTYAGNGLSAGPIITLGYEPQWLLIKCFTSGATNWILMDNMRGIVVSGVSSPFLNPNTADAEATSTFALPLATGFQIGTSSSLVNSSGQEYIYIAIRRGPMKTPTVGTSVFGINARTGTGANETVTGGTLPDDVAVIKARSTGQGALWATRFAGRLYAQSDVTSAMVAAGATILQTNPWDVMDGIKVGTTSAITNASTATYINYLMRRAPGFMDVVAYTGINPSITHNLGVTPEMYIVKSRDDSGATGGRWSVYHTGYATATNYIALNSTNGITAGTIWGSGPTATTIGATGNTPVNNSGFTYIAYLFATLAGVSKVGSYTGTGALQTVNCGFTTGARFVLIKRTDTTGDWYTYDSARGLSSSTDPYFLMNSSAAETTGTNYVDTDTTGFKVTAAAPADLNAVGGNYIFLAIA